MRPLVEVLFYLPYRLCHGSVAALLLEPLEAGEHPVGQQRLLGLDGGDVPVLSALAAMSLVGRLEAARVIDSLNLLTPSEAREVLELMEPDLGKP